MQHQTGLIPLQKPFSAEKPLQRSEQAAPLQAAAGDATPEPSKKILGYDAITWQKIIPLGFMFFCILFNYTILRDTKVCAVEDCCRLGAAQRPAASICLRPDLITIANFAFLG